MSLRLKISTIHGSLAYSSIRAIKNGSVEEGHSLENAVTI